jgi:hypothetical protein
MRSIALLLPLIIGMLACNDTTTAGNTLSMGSAGMPSGAVVPMPTAPAGSMAGGAAPMTNAMAAMAGAAGMLPAAGQPDAGGSDGGTAASQDASPPADAAGDATPGDAGADDAGDAAADPVVHAAGLHELFMHDACTGSYPPQPDTCLHEQLIEREITFGGASGTLYDVTLRVRGLFEPTTISGGQTPMPQHPYFKVGGSVAARDWSHWHIEISDPPQTYWLNHYPSTAHVIYQEDFEASIAVAGGASVVVRVIDGNDRQMDNAEPGLADRRQLIAGVTDEVLDGQMLRLDVVSVVER